jgi:hypothetical protein
VQRKPPSPHPKGGIEISAQSWAPDQARLHPALLQVGEPSKGDANLVRLLTVVEREAGGQRTVFASQECSGAAGGGEIFRSHNADAGVRGGWQHNGCE